MQRLEGCVLGVWEPRTLNFNAALSLHRDATLTPLIFTILSRAINFSGHFALHATVAGSNTECAMLRRSYEVG
jgi:hypothetical protein